MSIVSISTALPRTHESIIKRNYQGFVKADNSM